MFTKKPLLCAAISSILFVFLPILISLLGLIGWPTFFSIVGNFASLILASYFLFGFKYLGLKYKSKLLSVISLIGVVLVVILYLATIFTSGPINRSFEQLNQTISAQQIVLDNLNVTNASSEQIATLQKEMTSTIVDFFSPYLLLIISIFVIWLVYSVLFNVALIKLKEVKYAKISGILGLVSIGLFLSMFGVLLAIPATIAYYVMLVVILFVQAKKYREIR